MPTRRKSPKPWHAGVTAKDWAVIATSLSALAGTVRGDVRAAGERDRTGGGIALAQSAYDVASAAMDSAAVTAARVRLLTARVRALESGKKLAEHPEQYLIGPPEPPKRRSWWNPFRKEG